MKKKVDVYVEKLNKIYQDTILAYPPNNNLYFYVKHLIILKNYIPGCRNKGVSFYDHVLSSNNAISP